MNIEKTPASGIRIHRQLWSVDRFSVSVGIAPARIEGVQDRFLSFCQFLWSRFQVGQRLALISFK